MTKSSRMPDFIIIGAMRSGTTTLWTYLRNHPQIYMAEKKEIGYFADPKYQERSLEWYSDMFVGAEPDQVCGEASTVYSRWPHHGNVAERIAELCPNARFIYVIRNPIDRMYSHYAYAIQNKKHNLTFEQAIQRHTEYFNVSLYYDQIKQYLKYFSPERIHCVLHEDLVSNTEEVLTEIQKFLGLELAPLKKGTSYALNSKGDKLLREKLESRIKQLPGIKHIVQYMPTPIKYTAFKVLRKSSLGSNALKDFNPHPLTIEMRNELRVKFSGQIKELSEYLNRDLTHWV